MSVSLGELAVRFGCELRGDPDVRVDSVASLASARRARSPSSPIRSTARSSAHAGDRRRPRCGSPPLSARSRRWSTQPLCDLRAHRRAAASAPQSSAGIHPSAVVAPMPRVHPTAHVGPFAVDRRALHRSARGPSSGRIASIEDEVSIARRRAARRARHALSRVRIGARTLVQPGAVIGADGFGFAPAERRLAEGAAGRRACASARTWRSAPTPPSIAARSSDTVIEDGVKLDNQIQIAHNVRIGAHTAIAACVGISGSTTVGKRCMIGGARRHRRAPHASATTWRSPASPW